MTGQQISSVRIAVTICLTIVVVANTVAAYAFRAGAFWSLLWLVAIPLYGYLLGMALLAVFGHLPRVTRDRQRDDL